MPKRARELTAREVQRLKEPGDYPVGGVPGLALRVQDSGARSWVLRYRLAGRRPQMGLGPYPEVPLADAREAAREARKLVRQNIDPITHRKAARDALRAIESKRVTFDHATRQFLARKQAEFKNPKHRAQWQTTLDTYASPVIGRLPVDKIELAHIVQVLTPIWESKTETATRLRGRIENVLAYATASGFRQGDNPARWKGNLDAVLPKPKKLAKVKHHPALPVEDMPVFMQELRQRNGMGAQALELLILTAARSGEVRLATWSEMDLDAKLWTIPAERMKGGKTHVVPLSPPAVKLLESLPKMKGSEYVFTAKRGGPLSDMTLSKITREMGNRCVPHGMRSTFRDWCAERTNYPREVAEMALAHTIPSAVERAYRRGDLLAKRTRLMAEWAKFLGTVKPAASVTPIRSAK